MRRAPVLLADAAKELPEPSHSMKFRVAYGDSQNLAKQFLFALYSPFQPPLATVNHFQLAFQPHLQIPEPVLLQTIPIDAIVFRVRNDGNGEATHAVLAFKLSMDGQMLGSFRLADERLIPGETKPGKIQVSAVALRLAFGFGGGTKGKLVLLGRASY